MKRLIACTLIFIMLLSLAACKEQSPAQTEAPTAGQAQKQPVEKLDSLSTLRADMKPPVMAVADFGFPELSKEFRIMDYLMDEFPSWMAEYDFIASIPEERTIITCGYEDWGNLLCIVPRDSKSTVCVTVTRYMEEAPYETAEEVYRSESGEPILLLADTTESTSVSIEVTDSEGRGVSWVPYWETEMPIPDNSHAGALVMNFSPLSEKTAYDNAVDYGWNVPDTGYLVDVCWQSDYGYSLELVYNPGQVYDGEVWICEDDGSGVRIPTYQGCWRYEDGLLHLDMQSIADSNLVIQDAFPVLIDPFGEGWLGIFRTEKGAGLPQFSEEMEYDELSFTSEDVYADAIRSGWQVPEFSELMDSFWLSHNYALELLEDAVLGDNGGDVLLYDVDEIGAYTKSYSGFWYYEEGMLHLSLVPEFDNGYFIDDSFPVLTQDGELWIGRNEYGIAIPYFYGDMMADVLNQPKG